jgi:hypothetical protein
MPADKSGAERVRAIRVYLGAETVLAKLLVWMREMSASH